MSNKFKISDASFSGWAVWQHHRKFALTYIGLATLLGLLAFAAMAATGYGELMLALEKVSKSGDLAQMQSLLTEYSGVTGALAVSILAISVISVFVQGVVVRKMVHFQDPEPPMLGLRFGKTERALFVGTAQTFGFIFAFYVAVVLVVSLLAVLLAAFLPQAAVMSLVGFVAIVAGVGLLWLAIRTSLWPFFAEQNKETRKGLLNFDIFKQSFAATKGHVWPIVGANLLLILAMLAVSLFVNPIAQIIGGSLGAPAQPFPADVAGLANVGIWVRQLILAVLQGAVSLMSVSLMGFVFQKLKPENAQTGANVDVQA